MTIITAKNISIREGSSGAWEYKKGNDSNYTLISTYPITLENSNTSTQTCIVSFESNLTVISANHYFIIGSENIRIEGNNKIITTSNLNGDFTVYGLFQNGSFSGGIAQSNIEIKDMKYYNSINLQLQSNHGYFLQQGFGYSSTGGITGLKISNLINHGNINNNGCGGIGPISHGSVEIKNCITYGQIYGQNEIFGSCGGLFADYSFVAGDEVWIENCLNYGNINSQNCGGIFGPTSFRINKKTTISKCINFGEINGISCGGIFAPFCVRHISTTTLYDDNIIFDCSDCINYGVINNYRCSGIFGVENFKYDTVGINTRVANKFKVTNCYNHGEFKNFGDCCGIIGFGSFESPGAVSNYFELLIIQNSYNFSNILNSTQSGIISKLHQNVNINVLGKVKNCYSVTSGITENGIFVNEYSYPIGITFEDNNVTSTWNDAVAESTLLNFATQNNNFNNYNIDNVDWIQVSPGVPYVLACFNQSIYENTYANKLPGDIIDPSTPPPMATYSLVGKNSNFINFDPIEKTITILNGAPSGAFKVIIHQVQNNIYNNIYNTMLVSINIIAICFGENTLLPIITENKKVTYKRIKDIKIGEIMMTEYHGLKKIKYIYHKKIQNVSNYQNKNKDKLYVLKKQDYPELIQDLVLTGGHPILVNLNFSFNEMLKNPDMFLRNFYRLETYKNKKAVDFDCDGVYDIYNVILENNNKYNKYPIRINGILTESCEEYLYNKLYKIMK